MTRLKLMRLLILGWVAIIIVTPSPARGHAFPIRSEPRVGRTISASPAKVTVWFDGELEAAFSTMAVYNSAMRRVDKGDGRLNSSDATVLEVEIPPLRPGGYRVYWSIVAKDTHRTEGDFSFTVEGKSP